MTAINGTCKDCKHSGHGLLAVETPNHICYALSRNAYGSGVHVKQDGTIFARDHNGFDHSLRLEADDDDDDEDSVVRYGRNVFARYAVVVTEPDFGCTKFENRTTNGEIK